MLASTFSDQHYFPPFLNLETSHSSPVMVESIEVFRHGGVYLVRATSADGAVGVATCNSRARYFIPML